MRGRECGDISETDSLEGIEAEKVRVDFACPFTPYEQPAIQRATVRKATGYPVRFVSAQELIIHKLRAGRPRDIEDIRDVLARQQGRVDRAYLRHWSQQFAQIEGNGHLLPQLAALLTEWPPPGPRFARNYNNI